MSTAAANPRFINLDILRGFSLFGVLLANLQSFTYPGAYLEPLTFANHTGLDRGVEAFIRAFAEGSFYPLFATLFGLGFALQMFRPGTLPVYLRNRYLVLFGFGLLHAVLVWEGDILISYALLGLALLPLRDKPTRTLVVIIFSCLIYALVMFYLVFQVEPSQTYVETVTTTYTGGSYLEAVRLRLADLAALLVEAVVFFPHLLACFLIGLLIGRRGVQEVIGDRRLLRRVCAVSLSVGLPIVIVHTVVMLTQSRVPAALASLDATFGSAALGFAYAAGTLLLLQSPVWQKRLVAVGAVGRTSLTNYLMQSFIFTLLYYGYGGGLYARVPLSISVMLAVSLYALQMALSRWWLARHPQGPLEQVWRRLASRGPAREPATRPVS